MTAYQQLQTRLQAEPATWLVTGVAGFIGSNLLVALRSNWTLTPIKSHPGPRPVQRHGLGHSAAPAPLR